MKIKLTRIGKFGGALYIENAVQISKRPNDEVRIDFVDKKGFKHSEMISLKDFCILIYMGEREDEKSVISIQN